MSKKITLLIVILAVLALIAYPGMSIAKKPPKPDKPNNGNHFGWENGNHYGWGDGTKPPEEGSTGGEDEGEPEDEPEGEPEGEGEPENEPEDTANRCAWIAGNSHVGHLFLYQTDPETGEILRKGAWGKLRYNAYDTAFRFVFNGHKLVPGMAYTLIYLPETGAICLGSGVANNGGNVGIRNMQAGVDVCSLPMEDDPNEGALIVLVPSEDVVCDEGMVDWIPEDYLFGCDLITFENVDGCGEEPEESVLDIEKSTNGEDADEPADGPTLFVGDIVEWTYEVTNTGTETLNNIVVTDDQGVIVSCPLDTLEPGASMVCTGSGEVIEGQYVNVGTVVATTPDETEVTDSDPSHYLGLVDVDPVE